VRRHGHALTFGCYVGHTPLRLFAMGEAGYECAATDDDLARMRAVVREAVSAGAMDFATSILPLHHGAGGMPVPSRRASFAELEALTGAQGEAGRGVAALTLGDLDPDDLYELQLRTGAPFTYSAILARPDGSQHCLMEINGEDWARGARVWPQVTPLPLRFTVAMTAPYPFNISPAFAGLHGSPLETRLAPYGDPAWPAGLGHPAGGPLPPALGDLPGRRVPDTPGARRPADQRAGRGTRGDPARRAARPRRRGADDADRVRHRDRRRGRGRPADQREHVV
jgi:hypothetical protein